MKNKTFLANCALVLCAVIWGMNFIFQKQASQHLGAFTFISLRYYLGVLSLLPLFFYMRRRKALAALEAGEEVERWHGRRFWLASLGASLANWGGAVLVQIGLHVADATKAGFIESAYIALVPVLDLLLFRKKTSRRVWIGIAMAIVGLYLLCISDGFSLDVNDAAIMASTLCFALHILMWSRFSPHVDALPFRYPVGTGGPLHREPDAGRPDGGRGAAAVCRRAGGRRYLHHPDLRPAVHPRLGGGPAHEHGSGVQRRGRRHHPPRDAVRPGVGGLRHHAADHLLCPTAPSGACQAGACQGRLKPHTPPVSRRFFTEGH